MTTKSQVRLPKLRKIDYSSKKEKYHLQDPPSKRRAAINTGVKSEMRKTRKNLRQAAIAKKGRFNILRIYRRNKKVSECKTITRDMQYMNRTYGLGKTKDICGMKPKTRRSNSKKKRETRKKGRKGK